MFRPMAGLISSRARRKEEEEEEEEEEEGGPVKVLKTEPHPKGRGKT